MVHCGATILEAAGRAGIILNTVCGGKGTCHKCTVRLEPAGREVPACQYRIQKDVTVLVPAASRFFEQKILDRGTDRQIKINPAVVKKYLDIGPANAATIETALNRLCNNETYKLSEKAADQLKQLSGWTKKTGLTAVCHSRPAAEKTAPTAQCYNIISFEAGNTTDTIFGLAADIGTTTVVSKLIDLRTSRECATAADVNPQSRYGDDVISRIAYGDNEEKLQQLHQTIIDCLNEQIRRLCKQAGVEAKHIYEIVVAGNTTMNHIFLGFPIKQLGQAPYRAHSVQAQDRAATDMQLQINPAGNVHTIANIAGFVGSDTTAVAIAVGIDRIEEATLVIDIGTNGEIILAAKDKLYAASCAAGPALEGARITHGSRAMTGAIERVVVNGDDIDLDVIGGCSPRTICGSGLIDAVAVLLDLGILDPSGRFVRPEQLKEHVPPAILSRIIEQDGKPAFVLATNNDNENDPVILTQADIRQVQLAKGAIRAGIKLLQEKMGLADSQIKQVLLAGAFGNYIKRESALRIGLLPQTQAETVHFVGNAAATGAVMLLLNKDYRALAEALARKIQYIEIAHELNFQAVFAESMLF